MITQPAFSGRARAGFTLVEMMVTVSVLAIMVGMSAPHVSKDISHGRVNSAARVVAGDLENALSLAGRQRRPGGVGVVAAGQEIRCVDRVRGSVLDRRALGPARDGQGKAESGAPATVELVFRDGGPTRGEPGVFDVASYRVTVNAGNVVVLNTDGTDGGTTPDELLLQFGNHQAHYELKRLTSSASTLQQEINSVFAQLDSGTLSEAKTLSLTQQLLQLQAQFEAANA